MEEPDDLEIMNLCVLKWLGEYYQRMLSRYLKTQIDSIDLVQRFANDKMVTVHYLNRNKFEIPQFANKLDELHVASIKIKGNSSFRCGVVLHRGRLSSLEFSTNPKLISNCTLDDFSVDLHQDPNSIFSENSLSNHQGSVITSLSSKNVVKQVLPPKDIDVVREFRKRVSAVLPKDLISLLNETDGFRFGEWIFLGTRARTVVRKEGTFHIIAEKSSLALGVEDGQKEPRIKVYDELDDQIRDGGESFVDAMLTMKEGKISK